MRTTQPSVERTVVHSPGAGGKITVNHNTTVVHSPGAGGKITVNHNVTVVRASQAN